MDPGMLGFLHRVPGGINVALGAAGQAGHGAVGHSGGNGLHALVVHGRGNGKARLDDVHTQLCHQCLKRLHDMFIIHSLRSDDSDGSLHALAQLICCCDYAAVFHVLHIRFISDVYLNVSVFTAVCH